MVDRIEEGIIDIRERKAQMTENNIHILEKQKIRLKQQELKKVLK